MLFCRRDHFRTICVSNNEARCRWQQILRKIFRHSKKETIAMIAIAGPFLVRTKIRNGLLNFDDQDFSIATKSDNVGAQSAGQRQLLDRGKAETAQKTPRPACNPYRSLGLAAICGKECFARHSSFLAGRKPC
jgi:hypothetical protein